MVGVGRSHGTLQACRGLGTHSIDFLLMAELLSASILKGISDKTYEKRKQSALVRAGDSLLIMRLMMALI